MDQSALRAPVETSSSSAGEAPSERAKRKRGTSVLLVVRRVHLYLGLFLMPWVLLFGITALSFNHPTVGRGIEGKMIPPERVKSLSGFSPPSAASLAGKVSRQLEGGGYEMVEGSAKFVGWPLFVAAADGGPEVIILGLDQGRAILTKRRATGESERPSFVDQTISLPDFDLKEVATQLGAVHQKLGVETSGALRPHPTIHPELRFVARDGTGRSYNVVYNLSTGHVDGRPTDESRHAPFVELLESLHKQHHFPANFGPTFFWALMADLTALTLIIWALTGLVMWWQMKKLRRAGTFALVAALIVAGLVMTKTAEELTFGPERKTSP